MDSRIPASGLSLAALLMLAACGGGSSSGSGTTTGTLAITSSNADNVAGEVATSADDTIGLGDASAGLVTGAVIQGAGNDTNVLDVAMTQYEWLRRIQPQLIPDQQITGVLRSVQVNCTPSGTAAVQFNDIDNDGIYSTGDTLSVVFNDCVVEGAVFDGTFSMTIDTLTGDPDVAAPWSLALTFSFDQVSLVEDGNTGSIDGDYTMAIDSPDGVQREVAVDGQGLTTVLNGNQSEVTELDFDYTEQSAGGSFTLTMDGGLRSITQGGTITYETTQAFTGTDIVNNWPTAGRMKITGANSTSVLVIAQGGDMVELRVDDDGDGSVDVTVSTTWTDIASQ